MRLVLIAAVARNGCIGRGNELLCHLPEDQRHFRRVTFGSPVIMGRKTWDSLPPRFRPLPGRRNLVLTRNAQWRADGAEGLPSLDAALALVAHAPQAFVVGGGELYRQAIGRADELVLTEIDRDFEGDVWFPDWDRSRFRETTRERHHAGPPNDFDYAFVTYCRVDAGDRRPGASMPSLDAIQSVLQPLFPGLMGVRLNEVADDRVVAEMPVRPDLCTTGGILHGGAFMAFADTLGGVGTFLNLGPGKRTTTTDSSTKFIAAARAGTTVVGECVALHRGRTTMVWQTSVRNADDKLCAVVTQTQIVLDAGA